MWLLFDHVVLSDDLLSLIVYYFHWFVIIFIMTGCSMCWCKCVHLINVTITNNNKVSDFLLICPDLTVVIVSWFHVCLLSSVMSFILVLMPIFLTVSMCSTFVSLGGSIVLLCWYGYLSSCHSFLLPLHQKVWDSIAGQTCLPIH